MNFYINGPCVPTNNYEGLPTEAPVSPKCRPTKRRSAKKKGIKLMKRAQRNR